MMRVTLVAIVLLLGTVLGCAPMAPKPEQTQLQIREFQTRTYETKDTKMVMKAVMNTLQDDGYIIKEANLDLGLLTAQKELDVTHHGEALFLTLLGGSKARYKKNALMEASANVSEFGKEMRVRVNFQSKIMDNQGGVMKLQQVDDTKFYQEFFSKVDNGIFIE
ncbi:MAG: hypothetical protein MN733_12740 [Nitrososphaera sp.]|nr:hypothetical protein [Nitrososphaera sp.]